MRRLLADLLAETAATTRALSVHVVIRPTYAYEHVYMPLRTPVLCAYKHIHVQIQYVEMQKYTLVHAQPSMNTCLCKCMWCICACVYWYIH